MQVALSPNPQRLDPLRDVLKDSNYGLDLFSEEEISALAARITSKTSKGQTKHYVRCLVRNKDLVLKPEEVVRQLYLARLIHGYGYEKRHINVEHVVHIGRQRKRADIVVMDKERTTAEYIIVEVKKPKQKDGREQLNSYCNATGAPMGVWTNGQQIEYYQRKEPNYIDPIPVGDIPSADKTLQDLLNQPFTLKDLIVEDKLVYQRQSLKQIILEMEDTVLANAGVDVFEEVFKLIYIKLFDEHKSRTDKQYLEFYLSEELEPGERSDPEKVKAALQAWEPKRALRLMEFRQAGLSDGQLYKKINELFAEAKGVWSGIFADSSRLELTPSHLNRCVDYLQSVKLFNSNLQVVDEAFEYLVNKSAKGDKGQYFTPRFVIDMCVKMLNPRRGEYMMDTAAGSCGFPVHTIFHMTGQLFSNVDITEADKRDIMRVFGVDFDEKAVRVARTLNLIAGDGETNVIHLNTLDYTGWDERVKDRNWRKTYEPGFNRMLELQEDKNSYKRFNFGVLMANPPFAGDIKETRMLQQYDLGTKENGKLEGKVGRDILFIERNLDFLRPGGRMAVVLPQGRFNNISDKRIRDYIAEHARILAVVGLHGNTFKPHTGTKTSVLFVQKWNDDASDPLYYCPRAENYPIFFAVSQEGGKDNSGEYVYVEDDLGQRKLDKNGHLIIRHDLHNHDGELPSGVAEAFIAFAREQGFGFWQDQEERHPFSKALAVVG